MVTVIKHDTFWTISQLKDKIGFGGEHIELSGLRSIKVEIFNLNNELIGPVI